LARDFIAVDEYAYAEDVADRAAANDANDEDDNAADADEDCAANDEDDNAADADEDCAASS
jgi:hypothetical protein